MAQKSQQSALNELIAEQKLLCEEFDSAYVEVKGDDVVAVAVHTLNQEPIVGLRKSQKLKRMSLGLSMVVSWVKAKTFLQP